MAAPPPFFDIPSVRHPVRWALVLVSLVALLVATADVAAAHDDHAPLSEGFEARIIGIVDADGQSADPGVDVSVAADGALVTVTYDGSDEVVVMGEQASEPLVRLRNGAAEVNASSPQAAEVHGAEVDAAQAAELLDLVWGRAPEQWVPLEGTGTVTFMDMRGAPSHVAARDEFVEGDVAGEFRIPMTVGGTPYEVVGQVVAVELPSRTTELIVTMGGVLFAFVVVTFLIRAGRNIAAGRQSATPRPAPKSGNKKKKLAGVR